MLADALQTLGFQAPVAIANLFNFVLIVLVVHFGFHKPIQKAIAKRKEMAQETVSAHTEAQTVYEKAKKDSEFTLQTARLNAADIIAEATNRAERITKLSEERSSAQSQLMIERARQQIVKEEAAVSETVRNALSPKIAQTIMNLAKQQDQSVHQAYTQTILGSLK